jgi:predicted MPP superfamily phosphohydrolase
VCQKVAAPGRPALEIGRKRTICDAMTRLLSLLLHCYIAARLLPALEDRPVLLALVALLLLSTLLLMPMGVGWVRRRAHGPLMWASWISMGLFSSVFVLTVLRDVLLLVTRGAGDFGAATAAGVAGLALLITAWGYRNARTTARVVTVDVPVAGLPASLDGFRIAQISDVHVGPTIRAGYVQRIVEKVNRLDADVVAITGDLVDGSVHELAPHVAPLAHLQARHGAFFVTGNHEYYSHAPSWIAAVGALGIRVLLNEHVVLPHARDAGAAPAKVVLAGVTDYGAGHFDPRHASDPARAMAGSPKDAGVRVLLAHQPRSAPAAQAAGFDVQLSGHTHGGQFLPWNFFVRLQQPFVAGLHRLESLSVYISRGTGYWGPPLRFGAPSEITLLRLVRG